MVYLDAGVSARVDVVDVVVDAHLSSKLVVVMKKR